MSFQTRVRAELEQRGALFVPGLSRIDRRFYPDGCATVWCANLQPAPGKTPQQVTRALTRKLFGLSRYSHRHVHGTVPAPLISCNWVFSASAMKELDYEGWTSFNNKRMVKAIDRILRDIDRTAKKHGVPVQDMICRLQDKVTS